MVGVGTLTTRYVEFMKTIKSWIVGGDVLDAPFTLNLWLFQIGRIMSGFIRAFPSGGRGTTTVVDEVLQ